MSANGIVKKGKLDAESEAVLKAVKAAACGAGACSYLVAFEQNGLLTTHFEHMPMQSASRAIIALLQQFCRMEAANKNNAPEYRATMVEFKRAFVAMVATYNKQFDAIAANAKKTKTT